MKHLDRKEQRAVTIVTTMVSLMLAYIRKARTEGRHGMEYSVKEDEWKSRAGSERVHKKIPTAVSRDKAWAWYREHTVRQIIHQSSR